MAMVPFYTEFPEIALSQAKRITLREGENSLIPSGAYLFLESYCDETGCDCRRLLVNVAAEMNTDDILATIIMGGKQWSFIRIF